MTEIDRLIRIHARQGIIVDTNILLLLFVGRTDPAQIERFDRTNIFDRDDFLRLEKLLGFFESVGVLPFILAEINSLSLKYPALDCFRNAFRMTLARLTEIPLPSIRAAARDEFIYLGLTDAAIIEASVNNFLVLTDDAKLDYALRSANVDVLNFNHLRNWAI